METNFNPNDLSIYGQYPVPNEILRKEKKFKFKTKFHKQLEQKFRPTIQEEQCARSTFWRIKSEVPPLKEMCKCKRKCHENWSWTWINHLKVQYSLKNKMLRLLYISKLVDWNLETQKHKFHLETFQKQVIICQ